MTRLILFTLLSLLSSITLASPCKWNVTTSIASYHTDNKDYNEVNPGLGVERWCSPHFFQTVAIYKNSYKKLSLLGAVGWTPIRLTNLNLLVKVEELKIGAVAGGATGYENDLKFAAGIYTSWRFGKRWGMNIVYFPNPEDITRVGDGVYAIQLKREF